MPYDICETAICGVPEGNKSYMYSVNGLKSGKYLRLIGGEAIFKII